MITFSDSRDPIGSLKRLKKTLPLTLLTESAPAYHTSLSWATLARCVFLKFHGLMYNARLAVECSAGELL